MSVPVYLVLLHYPVRNRSGALVTTSVTNMDIHDIARSCRTFGIREYFLVTPIEDQHELVGRIVGHWRTEQSQQYHPDRVEAVSLVRMARSFEDVKTTVTEKHGEAPEVVLTDASPFPSSISYADYRRELETPGRTKPVILVFGTGWGVSDVFYPEVHRILAPVYGPKDDPEHHQEGDATKCKESGFASYNHLSVRSAVAIILDRLFGH